MPSSWLQKEYDAISVAYSKIPCLVPEPLFYDKDEQIGNQFEIHLCLTEEMLKPDINAQNYSDFQFAKKVIVY